MYRFKNLREKEKIEIEYWKDSMHENPNVDSIDNISNKISDAKVFYNCINRYVLIKSGRVLELGAGQGWASCVYKKYYSNVHVTATDISEYAIASLPKWEKIYGVKIDKSYSCKSYEILENDEALDQIFCFSAAHHFIAHRSTLVEIKRVLKPGGTAFYFYEPSSPKFFYNFAVWRVNRKRPEVPEDVLIISNLIKIARDLNFDIKVDYTPSTIKRSSLSLIYFSILKLLPFLQVVLPTTVNIIFKKNK